MTECVIFDIDGTLCDVTSARHHVEGDGQRDFSAFHRAAMDCPPHGWVADLARAIHADGCSVVVVTAREAIWMEQTVWWLLLHEIPFDQMYMRPRGDYRPDYDVKADIFGAMLAHGYKPFMAVDDNPSVIQLWEERNLTVITVPGWTG